jgi:hypothetical protein
MADVPAPPAREDARMKKLFSVTSTLLIGIFLAATASTAEAASPAVHVVGSWTSSPCVVTTYELSTGHIVCRGSSSWTGSLTGQTTYIINGTLNALNGNGSGTIDETFRGIETATEAAGTLRFKESFTLDGATNGITIDCRLIAATGAFAGASGTMHFTGTATVVGGFGGYEGWLTLPA